MKILHVINSLTTGGAETVLYRLATYPSGISHEIICIEGRAWYSDKLEANGIPVHHLNWSTDGAAAAVVRLHKLIRASNADLVQAWMYRSNLLAGISGKLTGKPVVWNIRASSLEPLRFGSRCLARLGGMLAASVPAFTLNCSAQSQELHAKLGYKGARRRVIPNGYDLKSFGPDEQARERVRHALGLDGNRFIVGCIARWHEQKGFPVLLRAVGLLRKRGLPIDLVLIGRDLDRHNAELATLVRQAQCEDCVHLVGERGDIPELARALDLHVLASVGAEGFPNVVAETMLSGTPNLVTDIGDSAFIVGGTGWVVEPDDHQALAEAIAEAFAEWQSRRPAWEERRRLSRARIADNFSIEEMVAAYTAVWEKVVKDGGRPVSKS